MKDLYSSLLEDISNELKSSLDKDLADIVCKNLTRGLVKSIYMPLVYGKTQFSATNDVESHMSFILNKKENSQITKIFYEVWDRKFPSITKLMKLVSEIAWVTAYKQRPFSYSNFIFTTIQDYMKDEKIDVWVYNKLLKKRHKITISLPTTSRNALKSMRSSFANLIHQFDASIAYSVIKYCMADDIPVYTVHDNFITNVLFASKMPPFYISAFLSQQDPLSIINSLLFDNLFQNSKSGEEGHADVNNHIYDRYSSKLYILTRGELEALMIEIMPPNLEKKQIKLWNKHCEALIDSYLSFAQEVACCNGELSTQCYLSKLRELTELMEESKQIGSNAVHPF